jgi:tryptophan halogenase
MEKISDFCIVGGGTSGLMATLILERYFPKKKITLIYSKHHKEIGVGESTNETFLQFLETVQIHPGNFYAHCEGAPKSLIKTKNWLRDNHDWYHFVSSPTNIMDLEVLGLAQTLHPLPEPAHYWSKRLAYNVDPEEEANLLQKYTLMGVEWGAQDILTNTNKKSGKYKVLTMPSQINFNNFKAIDYLRKVCIERGIDVVEDTIESHTLNKDTGFITNIIGKEHTYTSTFYFDCTGFKSILLDGICGSKRTDLSDDFLVNQFTAFPTPLSNSPDPAIWVETEGKDDCWLWRIEVGDRGGNGILSGSEFMTDESLENHVKEMGGDINDNRLMTGRFSPGYRKEVLCKNVLGVGIAAAFFEPLQATTFGYVLRQMIYFVHIYNAWKNEPEATTIEYNNIQLENIKNIYYYLRTQYITQKDTPFWKAQREDAKLSFDLKEKLKVWKYRPPWYTAEFGGVQSVNSAMSLSFFACSNFYQLLCGQELIDHNAIMEYNSEILPDLDEASKDEIEMNRWKSLGRKEIYIPTHIYIEAVKDIITNKEKYERSKASLFGRGDWTHYIYISNDVSYLIPIDYIFLYPHLRRNNLFSRTG